MTHFTPEEAVALRDEGSVDAAVIHPPGWEPSSTETAFKGVKDYPGRFAIMGSPPLDKPGSRYRIGSWRSRPGMLSCAFYTTRHAGFGRWRIRMAVRRCREGAPCRSLCWRRIR